ncbi:MAG TPA: hypothetical protein VNE62_05800 [Actinomycetota bacterium]|nr:hypothetical protein [Actinomycetota bacterium]
MTRAFRRALSVVTALLLLAAFMAAPAHASSSVQMTVTASGPGPATHGSGKAAAVCAVSVADGADGVAVLDAAVDSGCLDSYRLSAFPGLGNFVDCVDSVCGGGDPLGAGCWYWAMHENGLPSEQGVDFFRASQGDVLSFAYTPWGPGVLC